MAKKLDQEKVLTAKGSSAVPYRLRIYTGAAKAPGANCIAVVSDMSCAGVGVAGVIEEITRQVSEEQKPGGRAKPLILIEHCPARTEFEETFSLVSFRRKELLAEPQWTPLERADVERMIGECLECGSRCICPKLDGAASCDLRNNYAATGLNSLQNNQRASQRA